MGAEREATLTFAGKKSRGKALVETAEIIFRPTTKAPRVIIRFDAIATLRADAGTLIVTTKKKETYAFDLGDPFAARWAQKISNPPTLLDKLGVKAGAVVALVGDVDKTFREELSKRENVVVMTRVVDPKSTTKKADLCLLFIKSKVALGAQLPTLAAFAKSSGAAIWIVFPKGQKDPREADVLELGRGAGLADVKVARFSDALTALKFVARDAPKKK